MELFTNEGISYITSGIGVPLFMDNATESRSYLSFARVCVEVDQAAVLPATILVEIEDFGYFEVNVEYPWQPVQLNSKHCPLCYQAGYVEK